MNQETQYGCGTDAKNENFIASGTNHLIPVNGSQIDMQSLSRNISDRVRCEMDKVVGTVARLHGGRLAAYDRLVLSSVELAMKSVNACCGEDSGRFVFYPYQRVFSGNIENLELTAESKLNWNTDFK